MSEWRPDKDWAEKAKRRLKTLDFDAMHASLETSEYYRYIYEAGADAMLAGLMKHLRDMAALNLELAQELIYQDSQLTPRTSNQLARDSTAFLIVADYIEYDRLRLIGEDPYPAIPDEKA